MRGARSGEISYRNEYQRGTLTYEVPPPGARAGRDAKYHPGACHTRSASRPPQRWMMRPIILAIATVLASRSGAAAEWAPVVERCRGSLVVITTDKSLGSGFFVATDGTIATNHHVVNGATQMMVTTASGERYQRVYVLRSDEVKDIALLRIEASQTPALPIAVNDPRVGEEVLLMGAPRGLEQSVSTGVVSSTRLTEAGTRVIQTTAAASPGSSGGPLVGSDGKVLGVLTFSLTESQNLNFAVAARYVRGMVDALGLGDEKPFLLTWREPQAAPPPAGQQRSERATRGVVLAGYGKPAASFQVIMIELMNFLVGEGIEVSSGNRFVSELQPTVSIPDITRALPAGISQVLYVRLDSGWGQKDRLTVECLDRSGRQLWREEVTSLWAMTIDGAAKRLLKGMQERLRPRLRALPQRRETPPAAPPSNRLAVGSTEIISLSGTRLRLVTEPPGATVYVKGTAVGTTGPEPLALEVQLPTELLIVKAGLAPIVKQVTPGPGPDKDSLVHVVRFADTQERLARLEPGIEDVVIPAEATVRLRISPTTATVYVDGGRRAVLDGVVAVEPSRADRRVTVSCPDCVARSFRLKPAAVAGDRTIEILVELSQQRTTDVVRLRIVGAPDGTEVFLNGAREGVVTNGALVLRAPKGVVTLQFIKRGYVVSERRLSVVDDYELVIEMKRAP